ncbi:MAG: single-stranded DNA-binding protein [Ruminococcus sp.]|nr:single-stranded DNA-binding protein [Ruminococcus sp.]
MNKVILVGRLTADPELRQTQSGIASCRFTVAVDRKFADKNTGERQTDFIRCTAWRQTAELITRFFTKGKMIAVEGSLRNDNYQDKKYPDVTHYGMDVLVDTFEFVGSKNESGGNAGTPQNNTYQAPRQTAPVQQAPANGGAVYGNGNIEEYEEILSDDDGDLPF